MEKLKNYLPLINELLDNYSGTAKNEELCALGSESTMAFEMHSENAKRLTEIVKDLKSIKLFIEEGTLPGNDTQEYKQRLLCLFESIDIIIKKEELADNYNNCSQLASLFKDIDDILSESK